MFGKLALLLVSFSLTIPTFINQKAVDGDIVVSDLNGDHFQLTEDSFDREQSFVYTARANINEGQACGLVFGAQDNDHYWVFNIDRFENKTKLLYFYKEMGELKATVLEEDYYIGNDKIHDSEKRVINGYLRNYSRYELKIVITREGSKTYGEFFIDNIKRFGVDRDIDLSSYQNISYVGGQLGYNVFRSSTTFNKITIGKNDFSYYTELYRNQFHYSQYAHWNNDPNGLVYYKGYYHMYYQTNPFDKQWGPMFWGHARSRDLVHWQELPIALFTDDGDMGVGTGVGYAWSGMAMVYHKGMSSVIDERNYFPNGNGDGLIGYYTRDGDRQDQVIITSDDEGLTWVKRQHIPQDVASRTNYKVDCRDPSVFPLVKDGDHVTTWGMALSGGTQDKIWFIASENMVDWFYVGEIDYVYAECVTVSKVKADDNTEHYVLTVSSRDYIVGDFSYDAVARKLTFNRLIDTFVKMDYGEDSYAAQCFYIDDENSSYYGQNISISWFSGLPSDAESGVYANVRDPWNGGGMTMPVSLGLKKVDGKYKLTQKPISINNVNFEKESVVSKTNLSFNNESNPLSDVSSHLFELSATISNPNEESVEFKVNESNSEYTAFGWNKTDGYYFDRRNTSDAGITFVKHYHHKFTTGPVDGHNLSFYVLVDNGGLELFAGDYCYNFYNLTLAAPYSLGASLTTSGTVTIDSLQVNTIKSVWKDFSELEEGVLYLEQDVVDLDMQLATSREVGAYSSNGSDISWEITSGEDVISLTKTKKGALITAIASGEATVKVTSGDNVKQLNIKVDPANIDFPFDLTNDGVKSGNWRIENGTLVGELNSSDAFYVSNESYDSITYSASINLGNAAAAGLLLAASSNLSSYLMVNYDKNAHQSKIWSNERMISVVNIDAGSDDVTITTNLDNGHLNASINGHNIHSIDLLDTDPKSGYIGLNVFNGKAIFNQVSILTERYNFENKDVVIDLGVSQYIKHIYNVTNKNNEVMRDFFNVQGKYLTLKKDYFRLLKDNTSYEFFVEGEMSSFTIRVVVGTINRDYTFVNQTINYGQEVTVYVDVLNVTSVTVDDKAVDSSKYYIKDYVLHLDASLFNEEEVEVTINNVYSFTVTVENIPSSEVTPTPSGNRTCGGGIMTTSIFLSFLALLGATSIIVKKINKKRGHANGEDGHD